MAAHQATCRVLKGIPDESHNKEEPVKAITFHSTTFTETELEIRDDNGELIDYGDIPYDDDHTVTEKVEVQACWEDLLFGLTSCDIAVTRLRERGLHANGSGWFSDPDGSQITDYSTAERVEVTGHLVGFTDREQALVEDLLGD